MNGIFSPAGNYMFKDNCRNTRTRCEICSKLTTKRSERHHWCRTGVFIVNYELCFTPCSVVNYEQVNADLDSSVTALKLCGKDCYLCVIVQRLLSWGKNCHHLYMFRTYTFCISLKCSLWLCIWLCSKFRGPLLLHETGYNTASKNVVWPQQFVDTHMKF